MQLLLHFIETFEEARDNTDNRNGNETDMQQPRSQALSSMQRRGGKTLVRAGHVIVRILIA